MFHTLFNLQEADAKIKARQEVVAGPLKERLVKLAALLASSGGKYMTGDQITYAE